METYLHGIEFKETAASSPTPVSGISPSVVGLVGTAPIGPVNTPTRIRTRAEAAASFGSSGGTIPEAIEALFGHHATAPTVVMINVADPANVAAHRTDVAAADMMDVGPVIDLGHADVLNVVVQNTAGLVVYDVGDDYTVDAAAGRITLVDGGALAVDGTADVKIAYSYFNEAGVTNDQIIGEVAADGSRSGIEALHSADAVAQVRPKILIAPGKTHTVAVGQALGAAADRLLGLAIVEGPGTTNAAASAYRANMTSRRIYVIDPGVKVALAGASIVNRPVSAYAAAAIAASDADPERGWWHSPTNAVIRGIVGAARPVGFSITDPQSDANLLNADEIATVVYAGGAYRLWGDRGCAPDDEANEFGFISAVRIADQIREALVRSHLWAVSRNITATYLQDVAASVNDYLAELVGLGALLGGNCEPAGEFNTVAQISMGNATWAIDYHGALPAERLTFRARINDDYIAAITGEVQ